MKVVPLSVPTINWSGYIESFKSIFGYSPTKCLDDNCITLEDKGAYLSTLGFGEAPYSQILNGVLTNPSSFKVCNYSFIFEIDIDLLLGISQTELKMIYKTKGHIAFCIVSGSLYDWYMTILSRCCSEDQNTEHRQLYNKVYSLLENAGLIKFDRVLLTDGTYLYNENHKEREWILKKR